MVIQQEILEQRTVIVKQEAELKEMRGQLEDYHKCRQECATLKLEYDQLYERYTDLEHALKETRLKTEGLEQAYGMLERERGTSHMRLQELTNLLHERSVEANNEKKALREFLGRLEQEKGLAEEGAKGKDTDFSSYRVAKVTRPFNLADYFIRLKTTSISSDKYAETVDILYELFKNEQAEAVKSNTKLDSSQSATA